MDSYEGENGKLTKVLATVTDEAHTLAKEFLDSVSNEAGKKAGCLSVIDAVVFAEDTSKSRITQVKQFFSALKAQCEDTGVESSLQNLEEKALGKD